jgi:peptidoglycan-N-acetylglucosamine deacetylase
VILRLLIAAIITVAGFTGAPTEYLLSESSSSDDSAPRAVYFEETGQFVEGAALDFWVEFDGARVFGYPISGELNRNGARVQYFERAVFEIQPGGRGDEQVQLRKLGEEAAGPINMRNGAFEPSTTSDGDRYFPETAQQLSDRFSEYWEANGGEAIFGPPISAEFSANGSYYQYFENAVLKYSDHDPDGGRVVQLNLGTEVAAAERIDTSPVSNESGAIVYSPELWGVGGAGPDELVVYLTFDDGPHSTWTPAVLEILAEYDAAATFFVLGKMSLEYPELIREIVRGGHSIGNHTWDHPPLAGMSWREFEWQLMETQRVVGSSMAPCMRPPYGSMDSNTESWAASLGYETILWDVDPRDWERPGAQVIADRILQDVHPGAVILLHDGGDDRSQSVEALKIVLENLDYLGYRFEPMCR